MAVQADARSAILRGPGCGQVLTNELDFSRLVAESWSRANDELDLGEDGEVDVVGSKDERKPMAVGPEDTRRKRVALRRGTTREGVDRERLDGLVCPHHGRLMGVLVFEEGMHGPFGKKRHIRGLAARLETTCRRHVAVWDCFELDCIGY